jgi:hypothetical protein
VFADFSGLLEAWKDEDVAAIVTRPAVHQSEMARPKGHNSQSSSACIARPPLRAQLPVQKGKKKEKKRKRSFFILDY